MPWEVTFRRIDENPLGEVSLVRQGIEAAIPEIQFFREPSGREKIEVFMARGVALPESVRAIFEQQPAKLQAHLQVDELLMLIYGFGAEPLLQLHAEIRGAGNPIELLRRICAQNSWKAIDDSTGETIDLSDGAPAAWKSFTDYREKYCKRPADDVANGEAS
jgi:hypothetical protein